MGITVDGNELILSGYVGDSFFDEGFDSGQVISALAKIGRAKDITVRINSGGGIATEGAAIYSALTSHKGTVAVIVEGIAASAASLIAMAGASITMSPGAVMMIHDPAGLTFGDAAAHQKTIEALNALGDSYAAIYAERSGKTLEEARQLMRDETWFDGPAAVKAGFATSAGNANDNDEAEATAFAYGIYTKAPDRLVALANARGWKPRAHLAASAVARKTEKSMDPNNVPAPQPENTPDATARAAEIATLCAAANVASLAAGLISSNASLDEARARIADAGEIRAMVAAAGKVNSAITAAEAEDFIARNVGKDAVCKALFDKLVANQSPEVAPQVDTSPKAASAGWDKAVDRVNSRI